MSNQNTHKPGYQHTPLGWIPEEWTIQSLDDLAIKVGSGITPTGGEKVYKKEGRYFLYDLLKKKILALIKIRIGDTHNANPSLTSDPLVVFTKIRMNNKDKT